MSRRLFVVRPEVLTISLSEKFCCQTFITSIKVIDMTRHSGKKSKLRNINTIGCRMMDITIEKWKINNIKIKFIPFLKKSSLVLTKPPDIDKCKLKNEASVSETLALFN